MNKTFLRVQQITIDVPLNYAEPFIHVIIQKVIRNANGKDVQIIDRFHQIHKKLTEIAFDKNFIHDPVTDSDIEISVAGVDRFIRLISLNWMMSQFGGKIVGDEIQLQGE